MKIKRTCMVCGLMTTNSSGFCSVQSWDSCKKLFKEEYGILPTKAELKEMEFTT